MSKVTPLYFKDFLKERKEKYDPNESILFSLSKIQKIDFSEGKIHLGAYKPTKTKQIIVEPNDFVFSGLNIEKGAVSINQTGERLVVSINYSTCEVDYSKIDRDYLAYFMHSQAFKSLLIDSLKKDYGFTRPKHLMPLSFSVPVSLDEQKKVVRKFQKNEDKLIALDTQITHQADLLKKLRQRILQEAIEGKLTAAWRADNPDVEPASALLERIQAEKAQLVTEKKIRKQKELPPITKDEIPFDLPQGWEWCRLGKATFGFQYGTSQKSLETGKVPVLRMGNLQKGEIVWDSLVYTDDEEDIKKFQLVDGDLLFNRTNSRELVGKTGLYRGQRKSIYAGYLVRFHMEEKISPDYTNFVMNSELHRDWCNEVKTDAIGQSNINATKLSHFRFPLPPLAEQKAIVAKVSKLLALCDQLEGEIAQNQDNAEKLMQAVLREAFSSTAR